LNDNIVASWAVQDVGHRIQRLMEQKSFPSFKILIAQQLSKDYRRQRCRAFGFRAFQSLHGAFVNMQLAIIKQAFHTEFMTTVFEKVE
jgi:hypothetical protein